MDNQLYTGSDAFTPETTALGERRRVYALEFAESLVGDSLDEVPYPTRVLTLLDAAARITQFIQGSYHSHE